MIKEINPDFMIHVSNEPFELELNESENHLVDEIWIDEKKESHLNENFLHLISLQENSVIGCFVAYKYYLAQEKVPSIRDKLQLCPIALSGVSVTDNAILLGQRSQMVTQFPLYWELAPSGGISEKFQVENRIDHEGQILQELEEETGIVKKYVLKITPKWLYFDENAPIMDICLEIQIQKEGKNPFKKPTDEYLLLEWIDHSNLNEFLTLHQGQLVPTSIEIANKLNKLIN